MNDETPSDDIFKEMKDAAIKVWKQYDDTHGYVTEKIERINSITNIQDNVMVFYRMFDVRNQSIMKNLLSPDAIKYIKNNN